ncbi:MAG: helix-turn-helix domain-containing protein [Gammaproteobacteria bacterium]
MRRSMTNGAPGVHFREAREYRKLSQQDVALQLRLSPDVIDAIESDDYHKLPSQIFVRGYLRSYARLLNLSEEEIIDAFNQLDIAQSPLPPPTPTYISSSIGEEGGRVPTKSIFHWFIYLSILLAIILLAKWFIIENPSLYLGSELMSLLKSIGWG